MVATLSVFHISARPHVQYIDFWKTNAPNVSGYFKEILASYGKFLTILLFLSLTSTTAWTSSPYLISSSRIFSSWQTAPRSYFVLGLISERGCTANHVAHIKDDVETILPWKSSIQRTPLLPTPYTVFCAIPQHISPRHYPILS